MFYNLIYTEIIKLKKLKIYIKINLINNFISYFKLFTSIAILFVEKKDVSFYLYINNWKFKNSYYQNIAKTKINIRHLRTLCKYYSTYLNI